jgi:OOP family OmpA-OmpF porin
MKIPIFFLFVSFALSAATAYAQTAANPGPAANAPVVSANLVPQPGQVVVSGIVPDENTHLDVLRKLQAIYGAGKILDNIEVQGDVVAPKNWSFNVVNNVITNRIKNIHRGQLEVDGTQVRVSGEVASEAMRQNIVNSFATALPGNYRIASALRVIVDQQKMLDKVLANRIVEFEVASAVLTPKGKALLDELADILPQINSKRIQIIGHTDSTGRRATNIALSLARAEAVKAYLVQKGLPAERFDTIGVGPDQPVASNLTPDGRARNRRIEFRESN